MAKVLRKNITTDSATEDCFSLWRKRKGLGRSEVIRLAVQAYTKWKAEDLKPRPEDFDGVDVAYDV